MIPLLNMGKKEKKLHIWSRELFNTENWNLAQFRKS